LTNSKIEPEWVTPREAGLIMSLSRPSIYKLIAQGDLDARKWGPNKTLISVASIRAYLGSLPKVQASIPKPHRPQHATA
jgi:hypothetical protein